MLHSAFLANATTADRYASRLRGHASAGRLAPGPLAWTGEKGSLVGCLLESEDLGQWESALGLPLWLALAADALAASQPSPEQALEFGVRLLATIKPGADVGPVGSKLILRVLDDMAATAGDLPEAVGQALTAVQGLHQRLIAGECPRPAEWRSARRLATGTTDTLPAGPLRALGTGIETAAWDPATSRSVVYDTVREWNKTTVQQAMLACALPEQQDAALRARLKEMFDTYMKGKPEETTTTVFELLAKHHPEEELALRNHMAAERAARAAATERASGRASTMLLELLQQA